MSSVLYAEKIAKAHELARGGDVDGAIALLDPEDAVRRAEFEAMRLSAMTFEEAEAETIKLLGQDSFTESDDQGERPRFYVGACPKTPGIYQGFMGFSWEEALDIAKRYIR